MQLYQPLQVFRSNSTNYSEGSEFIYLLKQAWAAKTVGSYPGSCVPGWERCRQCPRQSTSPPITTPPTHTHTTCTSFHWEHPLSSALTLQLVWPEPPHAVNFWLKPRQAGGQWERILEDIGALVASQLFTCWCGLRWVAALLWLFPAL